MIEPILPSEVEQIKASNIPDEVILAFNELIAEKWNGSFSVIKQDDAMERVLRKFEVAEKFWTRNKIFENKWLDVEYIYRQKGWNVEYDKPGYNESYDAFFKFSLKK